MAATGPGEGVLEFDAMPPRWLQCRKGGAVVLLTLLLGCSLTLVSPYDPQIDRTATTLQKQMDAFLTGLREEDPGEAVPNSAASRLFFDAYAVELRSVLIRAESHPKNQATERQLRLMIDNLEQLRVVDQSGPIDDAAIDTFRDLFNQGWRAIITLEVAKKR